MAEPLPIPTHGNFQDLRGRVFAFLTVENYVGRGGNYQSLWSCRCICGNEKVVTASHLKNGSVTNCGCRPGPHFRHGQSRHGRVSPEYVAWQRMKSRCYYKNDSRYSLYGAKSVTVCPRWINSFENFLADMGPRPSPEHSVDRFPDKHGNYEPENCRWATRLQQARNKRTNVLITFNGISLTAQEWSERTGILSNTIKWRISHGWSAEKTLTYKASKPI